MTPGKEPSKISANPTIIDTVVMDTANTSEQYNMIPSSEDKEGIPAVSFGTSVTNTPNAILTEDRPAFTETPTDIPTPESVIETSIPMVTPTPEIIFGENEIPELDGG